MSRSTLLLIITATILIIFTLQGPASSKNPHIINFRSLNLYPESLTWDPSSQHFITSSLRYPLIQSISDAAVVDTLISDSSLLFPTAILGIAVDKHQCRLLATVHSPSSPPFSALASYDVRIGGRHFLTPLPNPNTSSFTSGANDVAVDFSGNAFVTNSASNLIYKP